MGGIAQVALPRGLFSFGEWLVQHDPPYLWVGNRFRCAVEINTRSTGAFVVNLPEGCWTDFGEGPSVRSGRCALDGHKPRHEVVPLPTGMFTAGCLDIAISAEGLTVTFLAPGRRLFFRASRPLLEFEPGEAPDEPEWLEVFRTACSRAPELPPMESELVEPALATEENRHDQETGSEKMTAATPGTIVSDNLFTPEERKVLRLFAGASAMSLATLSGQLGRRASGKMADLMEKVALLGHPVIQITGHDEEGPTYGRVGTIPAEWLEEGAAS